jgi:hypothetical protein
MNIESMEVHNVGVDAGLIVIADLDWFKSKKGYKFEPELSSIHTIDPGEYQIEWNIEDTCNGPVEGSGILKVTSGTVVVSDPCYLIDNEANHWGDILDETNFFETPPDGMIVLDSMGGDGCYNVNIKLFQL